MAKRSRADVSIEAIYSVFERLSAVIDTSNAADDTRILKRLKDQVLSELAEEEGAIHMQAKEFTLSEAVEVFGLTYSTKMSDLGKTPLGD